MFVCVVVSKTTTTSPRCRGPLHAAASARASCCPVAQHRDRRFLFAARRSCSSSDEPLAGPDHTIAWTSSHILLAAGIIARAKPARVAAVIMIAVTTFKCFLYDLRSLEGLYRVSAFVGLAISLALVSLALQKYVLAPERESEA